MSEEGRPHLTVVIPTFNRSTALLETVASVFASELADGVRLEVIVVDDGSAERASAVLRDVPSSPDRSLRVVRQENRGVGAARNRGRREASGDVVLFVDDDMLLLPRTLQGHIDAHCRRPGSVIFGCSPYVDQPSTDAFVTWVLGLETYPPMGLTEDFVAATIIASGHLSVDRAGRLGEWSDLYADDMRTPVAEEYELSYRLGVERIPVYRARHIRAWHNRRIEVDSFLRQQFGHGRGCAEAARLHPECLALDDLRGVIERHQRRSPRRVVWTVLGTMPARSVLHRAARAGQRGQLGRLAPRLFRLSAGAWFSAGVRTTADIAGR